MKVLCRVVYQKEPQNHHKNDLFGEGFHHSAIPPL